MNFAWLLPLLASLPLSLTLCAAAIAQAPIAGQTTQAQLSSAENENKLVENNKKEPGAKKDQESMPSLLEEMRQMRQLMEQMRQLIERQEARISQLEAEKSAASVKTAPVSETRRISTNSQSQSQINAPSGQDLTLSNDPAAQPTSLQAPTLSAGDRDALDFWRDTTVNVVVDGYYGYNFNRPLGGINLLRAYDVLSNSFSLNQAGVILEQTPEPEEGRRFGARLDLMFGQATETVQGSAINELRPQVYRHVWQAYGSYVAPLGNGLTVDFGKFAGALGYETNYTKDNFNYSRSYWFLFLPFYHLGFRAAYPVNEKLTATYYLINGINQSEDFNAWKSQAVLLTFKPTSRITAQANYFNGQEGRVRTSILNPTFPVLPTQPGLSPIEIRPEPDGRTHILDAYATLNATDRLTFAFQGDYVINRVFQNSPPSRVWGGAAYARYQFSPGFALASRFEYLSDRLSDRGESLFSGLDQALKEITMTAEYKFGDGFLLRGEYRRDWSNRPFFLTAAPGVLKKEQNTATLGLVWWFGRKQGSW